MTIPSPSVTAQILLAKHEAIIETRLSMLRECILDLCEVMSIDMDDGRREKLSALDLTQLEATRATMKETWAWPFDDRGEGEYLMTESEIERARQRRCDRTDELQTSLDAVIDASSLLSFITLLLAERAAVDTLPISRDGHQGRWANHSVSAYLEAALSCTMAHLDSEPHAEGTPWKFFAKFLYAGRIYE